jgi:hypothetical protein
MPPLVAMAGPAEAAIQAVLFMAWSGLAATAVLLLLGLSVRSAAPTVLGVCIWLVLTGHLTPWRALAPIVEGADDPDVVHWANAARRMAIGWVVVSIATLLCAVVKGLQQRRAGPATRGTEPDGPGHDQTRPKMP